MDIKLIIENLKQKDKKGIQKIIFIIIIINLLMALVAMFTNLFTINKIIRTVINSLLGVVNIILVIFMLKPEETIIQEKKAEIKKRYNPIALQFFRKSEVDASMNLLLAECLDLQERNLLEISKNEEDCIFTLKNDNFVRMNGVETVEENKIDDYGKEGIPAYENLYVTKILFPFENTISFKDMIKKSKEGYYQSRVEMCQLLLEKMIVHELEKNNELKGDKSKIFLILLIVNIIVAILALLALGVFNIVLLLGTVANLLVSIVLLKNENIFAYSFTPEISNYIDSTVRYAKQVNLNDEEIEKDDLIVKMLFGDIQIDSDFFKFL